MKVIVRELIRKYGMQRLLETLIDDVSSCKEPYLIDLTNDLQMALNRYKTRYERYPDDIQEPNQSD
jgi:hypothetical protein